MTCSIPAAVPLLAIFAVATPFAAGQVLLTAQQRSIVALSSLDGVPRTAAAPNFAPFVTSVNASTSFTTPSGDIGFQTVATTINCFADPNAITANGQLSAAGGLAAVNGVPTPLMGDSKALVLVFFDVTVPTPFLLTAIARPDISPGDEYRLRLTNESTHQRLFSLDDGIAPTAVNFGGVLQPGSYSIEFRVELSGAGAGVQSPYSFGLFVPSPCAAGLFASLGLFSSRRRR